jgi:hypothetical protein
MNVDDSARGGDRLLDVAAALDQLLRRAERWQRRGGGRRRPGRGWCERTGVRRSRVGTDLPAGRFGKKLLVVQRGALLQRGDRRLPRLVALTEPGVEVVLGALDLLLVVVEPLRELPRVEQALLVRALVDALPGLGTSPSSRLIAVVRFVLSFAPSWLSCSIC